MTGGGSDDVLHILVRALLHLWTRIFVFLWPEESTSELAQTNLFILCPTDTGTYHQVVVGVVLIVS